MNNKITKSQAEEAVRVLISWAGDNPDREELLDTPRRVVESYQEFFKGYEINIDKSSFKTFVNKDNYDEMIILRDIRVESHCEHHMVPIIGNAIVAYIPDKKIIGLSKIPRIIDIFAKRLQIQERLVIEVAQAINKIIEPIGVGVFIESSHQCLTTRGAYKPDSLMQTMHLLGCFKQDKTRKEFLNIVNKK
ncbi:MAG: GTP cyclohydrolase I FolE [Rickettsiales bacterium]